jgi:hypothetical protein
MRLQLFTLLGSRSVLRRAAVLLSTALLVPAARPQILTNPPMHVGSLDVWLATAPYPPEITIKRGKREWQLDPSQLVRANDCALPYRDGEPICQGSRMAPCPDCLRQIGILTWDERRQKLYFILSTADSWEKPWTIFNYNLITRRTSRFISTWTAGFDLATISSSGQYLAYIKVHHSAPVGPCFPRTDIEIVDLWAHRVADPPRALPHSDADSVFFVDKLNWSSRSKLEYVASRRLSTGCVAVPDEQPLNGEIEVPSLSFR